MTIGNAFVIMCNGAPAYVVLDDEKKAEEKRVELRGECAMAAHWHIEEASYEKPTIAHAIQKELAESFELAEGQLAAEKLSGNRVKEEFWQGELSALHRMRHVVEANKKPTIAQAAGTGKETKP